MDKKEHKTPKLAVDVIVPIIRNGKSCVVMVHRKNDPVGYALPGGFVDCGESCENAASRELFEETGLLVVPENMKLVTVASEPKRDPREHIVSVVYAAMELQDESHLCSGDDAESVTLLEVETLSNHPVVFDHMKIIFKYFREPHRTLFIGDL